MAQLGIRFLGGYQVTRGSAPIDGFVSDKVRALLAYLVVESGHPHKREILAGLLWPDTPDTAALASLRNALANLRRVIGDREANPPYLLITSDTLQFNRSSDYYLDAEDVLRMDPGLCPPPSSGDLAGIMQKITTVGAYKGPFLAGLSVPDNVAFEEWVTLWREKLARIVLEELGWLADHFENSGEYAQALEYARRQVALEPWLEEAHRKVMRILALAGQRSAALA